jgi:hypothetical protein
LPSVITIPTCFTPGRPVGRNEEIEIVEMRVMNYKL